MEEVTPSTGYFVTILAEEKQLDEKTLCIVNDSLRVRVNGATKEFEGIAICCSAWKNALARIGNR